MPSAERSSHRHLRAVNCFLLLVVACAFVLFTGYADLALGGTPIVVDCGGGDDLQGVIDTAPHRSTVFIYGTCTGQFFVGKDLVLIGQGANPTLDAMGAGTVLTVQPYPGPHAAVQIVNLTITHGTGSTVGGGIINFGGALDIVQSQVIGNSGAAAGGIWNSSGSLTLSESIISGNTASVAGAGILVDNGDVTITRSTISDNTVTSPLVGGGGILINEAARVVITTSTVTRNSATGDGGGITNFGTLTLRDSTVTENTAGGYGGSIFNVGGAAGRLAITDSTLSYNAAGQHGGAISNLLGTVSVQHSTLTQNTAAGNGGGVFSQEGHLSISASDLIGNNADYGGAILQYSGSLFMTDSTLTGNIATSWAGGLFVTHINAQASVSLVNSVIVGNTAILYGAGGLFVGGDSEVRVTHCRVDGNTTGGDGGGINAQLDPQAGRLTLTDSSVAGNTASGQGGGILVLESNVVLVESSVTANTAIAGGGIANLSGSVVLRHSIVGGNTPDDCAGC